MISIDVQHRIVHIYSYQNNKTEFEVTPILPTDYNLQRNAECSINLSFKLAKAAKTVSTEQGKMNSKNNVSYYVLFQAILYNDDQWSFSCDIIPTKSYENTFLPFFLEQKQNPLFMTKLIEMFSGNKLLSPICPNVANIIETSHENSPSKFF